MATDNSGDLSAFVQFANAQLQAGAKLSLEEALEQWWAAHPPEPSEEESEEVVAMIQEALDDLAAGDKGMPFDEHLIELERKFGLKPSPKRA
ncbi:MAG: hypothetical protein K8U03_16800 [Planctomycetia bacterium]|nr:hypothetical protein [Planctomycetia bacterium]